jgi:hypothetical protein
MRMSIQGQVLRKVPRKRKSNKQEPGSKLP